MPTNTLTILDRLISIDTTIQKDTLEAANYIKELLDNAGIDARLLYNPAKKRASIIATIGNPDTPGIILSGHLDTVASNPSEWQRNPHHLTEQNGLLYGRGTTDMKGAIACVLGNLTALKNSRRTFHLVFTHDEEGGFSAIKQIVETNFDNYFHSRPFACIVMEPSELKAISAHKGAWAPRIEIFGKEAHSSTPDLAVDALKHAMNIYNQINNSYTDASFSFAKDNAYTPDRTTMNFCEFRSGDAINKIPGYAFLSFVVRNLPQDNLESFKKDVIKICKIEEKEMQKLSAQASIKIQDAINIPAFQSDQNSDFIQSFGRADKVSYCTEAGFYQTMQIPTIIYGPGSINQAHTADEFIPRTQLEEFEKFIISLAKS